MNILAFLDKKLQTLYAPASTNCEEEGLQKRKSHFYSLLFCLLLHTFTFFFIKEYHKEVYMLTVTSIIICIVIIMTIARRNIFYIDVCTTFLLVTITPVLTFMSEKYLFFSITGTWIIPSIILLMTQNHKLTFSSFGVLAIILKYYYKTILLEKISVSSVQDTKEYLDSQIDLLSLTGFFYFLSILNFNSMLQSKNKTLIRTQEYLQAALNQRDSFICSFSHELRNPMNVMLGNLELATLQVKDINIMKILKTAQVCGEILMQLVNNILDTAKADIGKLEVSFTPTNFRETLEKIWTVTSGMIKRKGVNGSLTISKSIPYNILLDQHRITQVLLNLVSNSVKFTENGSIQIRVYWLEGQTLDEKCFEPTPYTDDGIFEKNLILEDSLGQHYKTRIRLDGEFEKLGLNKLKFDDQPQLSSAEVKPGVLKIVVMDTGCGMSEAGLKKLFKRFSQVNEDAGKRKIGTGLGLWITKKICKKMNGKIEVYSQESVGTTFMVCIPCEIPGKAGRASLDLDRESSFSPDLPPGGEARSLKALYVDDNPDTIPVHRRFLERAGVNLVNITPNGILAVKDYQKQIESGIVTDLIMMDVDMPSQDVKEACKKIRELEARSPSRFKSAIVLFGTNVSEAEIQAFVDIRGEIKANYFYRKPLFYKDIENLVIAIQNSKYRVRPTRVNIDSSRIPDLVEETGNVTS